MQIRRGLFSGKDDAVLGRRKHKQSNSTYINQVLAKSENFLPRWAVLVPLLSWKAKCMDLCMATTAVSEFKLGLALEAYGIELRLWKEPGEREWGATLRHDNNIVDCHFEEDNLTLAKLHVLGEARNRVMSRSGNAELPGCNTFLDSWKPVKMAKP